MAGGMSTSNCNALKKRASSFAVAYSIRLYSTYTLDVRCIVHNRDPTKVGNSTVLET